MKHIISALVVFLVIDYCHSRIVERCELAVALADAKISKTFISNLVCAAERESARNTAKVRDVLHNKSKNYGIFQINSRDCSLCNIECDKLTSNNINDSVLCAKKIFETKGLQYWPNWMRDCKSQAVPDLSECFEEKPIHPVYPKGPGLQIPIPIANAVRVNRNIGRASLHGYRGSRSIGA